MAALSISCICPTYGRVDFLEELVYSFINQDYEGEFELIIVNDYSEQTLIYDHPRVKIYNCLEPFETIGEKVAFCISKASYDVIATFDDDDIALPNHLQNINKYFRNDAYILHWAKGGFWNEPNLTAITWIGNSGVVYTKEAIKLIGGVPQENAGYDTTMVDRIHTLGIEKTVFCTPTDEETAWFYRWGFVSTSCYHQSGQGTDDNTKPNILVRHAMHIESLRAQGIIPIGDIILNPHWIYDYSEQLKNFICTSK